MTRELALDAINASDNSENMTRAIVFLGKEGTVADISTLLPFAMSATANPEVKKYAVWAICFLIKENMLNKFSELTADMRQKLATIMHTLDPHVINDISADLMLEDEERRLTALQVLGLLRFHPQVKEILTRLLQDHDSKIKATAVNLLGKVLGPDDLRIVIALLNDKDKRVRANTVEAIESLGNKRLIPLLLKHRKDSNNRIRANVLKALYSLGYTNIEKDLLDMLRSNDDPPKASALWVITQVNYNKSENVGEAACACLQSLNKMVRDNAMAAMKIMAAAGVPRCDEYLGKYGLSV